MASAGEIFRTTLFYSIPNSSVANTVHYHALEGGSLVDSTCKTSISGFFTTNWVPTWADLAPEVSVCDYGQIDVLNNDGTVNRSLGTFVVDIEGGISLAEVMPAAVAAFLMAETALPKVRGRKYLPGLAEGTIADGIFNAGAITTLSALLVYYLASFSPGTGLSFVPGVLSRSLEYFVAFNAAGLVNDVPAYQRRRKPGVGS